MNQKHQPEELKLSNGIPVILMHSDSPVGTFHWWNFVGSTDESPKEAGFAHFLEHMLFKDAGAKDTGTASTGKTARIIESLGGEINAYTTFDQTVYHVTCSEQYWEKVIDQFGLMAKPQKFLNEDFKREREVILEELKRGEDSPDRQLYQTLFSLTYSKHPYGRPVIGYAKTLKAATVADLDRFYSKNYVSSQMGLVLVGPIFDGTGARKKKLLSVLEKRFGSKVIKTREAAPKIRPTEPALRRAPSFKAAHFDIKTPELAISFRIPELKHTDSPHLDVLAGVLGSGESSRLYQSLFYEKSIVTEVSASVYIPKDAGMFLISAELKKTEDLNTVLKAFVEEIKKLLAAEIRDHEISRVITNIESEKLYAMQTVDGIANRLGFLKYSLGDLKFDGEYLDHVKAVNSDVLQRLAEEYLTAERMSIALFQPKGETLVAYDDIKGAIAPLFSESTKQPQAHSIKSKKKSALTPDSWVTSSGLKVNYLERKGSPIYSLYAAAFGGSRSEGPQVGASSLLSQIWAKGVPGKSSKEMSEIIEGSAASLDGFSGRNTVGVQSTALTRDWKKLSSLFSEVLINPTLEPGELEHAKRVTIESIKSIPDHSSQVCSKLFMESLFGSHPYSRHPMGSVEQVESYTSQDLNALHSKFINPKNMSLTLVGGIPRPQAEKFFLAIDEALSKSKSNFTEALLPAPEALKAPRWANAHFGREQTHIMMGGLGITLFDESRFALKLLQTILGGQSGRLFIELREKRSMAYSVSPLSMEGLETGYVGSYIACAPEKADAAIQGMKSVIETLILKGPTQSEMTRAKNYYLGQRAMDLQSNWSLASSFGLETLYRGKWIEEIEIRKMINAVTAKQIQKVGERLFLKPNLLTVTVR